MNQIEDSTNVEIARQRTRFDGRTFAACMAIGCCTLAALLVGFTLGKKQPSQTFPLPLAASSSDSSDSMAMATGPISDDAEGVFFLDFNTGDLQCLVYYPRSGRFGAHYYTNVRIQLGSAGKNSKYLMTTGAIANRASSGGTRPGNSLVYVTDITTGLFAAYAVPWDRNAEATGRQQANPLVFVQGGPIRNYQLNSVPVEPPKVVDPKKP
jgi:hypothetical protein